MLVVGLGEAGCNIAELFKKQNKYEVVLLDEGKGIKKCSTVEEYDSIDYKPRKKAIKSATEGFLFVCGSGKVSGATLRILEALKHVKMTVVYIVPDLENSTQKQRLRNKVHFSVLQQYARSGMINEFVLFDNKKLLELMGHGTIYQYYDKVNRYIYTIIHTLNYCKNVKSEFGKLHERKNISNICTIEVGTVEEKKENMLFPLDNITETRYIININEDDLVNDIDILPNVQALVRNNSELERESSFAIWSTHEDVNYYYAIHYTHFIQEIT